MKTEIKELITSVRRAADSQGLRADPTACLLANELERLDKIINTPEFFDFIKAVPEEAAHQVERWGSDNDAGKKPEDWFGLSGIWLGKLSTQQRKAIKRRPCTIAFPLLPRSVTGTHTYCAEFLKCGPESFHQRSNHDNERESGT